MNNPQSSAFSFHYNKITSAAVGDADDGAAGSDHNAVSSDSDEDIGGNGACGDSDTDSKGDSDSDMDDEHSEKMNKTRPAAHPEESKAR